MSGPYSMPTTRLSAIERRLSDVFEVTTLLMSFSVLILNK